MSLVQCLERVQPPNLLEEVSAADYYGLLACPGVAVRASGLLQIYQVLLAVLMFKGKLNQVPLRAALHLLFNRRGVHNIYNTEKIACAMRIAAAHVRRIAINNVKFAQATKSLPIDDVLKIRKLCDMSNATDDGSQTLLSMWTAQTSAAMQDDQDVPPTTSASTQDDQGVPPTTSAPPTQDGQNVPPTTSACKQDDQDVPLGQADDPFAPSWQPGTFAKRASKNQRAVADEATPQRVVPSAATENSGVKRKVEKPECAGAKGKSSSPGREKPECAGDKGKRPGKFHARGIGRLSLSLGLHKSEICYIADDDVKRTRCHLTTVETIPEHQQLAQALVKLACATNIGVADLRLVKKEKMLELRKPKV
jgi:hypothetical protein